MDPAVLEAAAQDRTLGVQLCKCVAACEASGTLTAQQRTQRKNP